eukprot:UN09320
MFLNSFSTILRPFEAKVFDEKCQLFLSTIHFGSVPKLHMFLGHFLLFQRFLSNQMLRAAKPTLVAVCCVWPKNNILKRLRCIT